MVSSLYTTDMKNLAKFLLLLLACNAMADGPVIQTSPFTRQLLTAPDAGTARARLGVVATNNWPVTNLALQTPVVIGGTQTGATNINPAISGATFTGTNSGGTFNNTTNLNPAISGATFTGPNTFAGDGLNVSNVTDSSYPYPAPEAVQFANAAGINDSHARRDLVRFEEQEKKYGCWSNLLQALAFNPRFNPAAGLTFFGTNFSPAALQTNSWGCAFTGPVRIALSQPLTNYTVVVVWRLPVNVASGLSAIFGLADEANKRGMAYVLQSPAGYSGAARILNNTYSGTWANNGLALKPKGAVGYANHDYGQWNLEREVDVISGTTSGGITFWNDGTLSEAGQSVPAFTNNIGTFLTANELILGGDWTNLFQAYPGSLESIQVFNCIATQPLVTGAFKAARNLSCDSDTDYVVIGHSRLYPNGTNGWDYALQQNLGPNGNNQVLYNFTYPGSAAIDFVNSPFWPNRWQILADNWRTVQVYWELGMNDFALDGLTEASCFASSLNFFTNMPPAFNWNWSTEFPISDVQTSFVGLTNVAPITSNVLLLNNDIRSHSYLGYRFYDQAAYVNPSVIDPYNPAGYTTDGDHFNGANGWQIFNALAQLATYQQTASSSATNAAAQNDSLSVGLVLNIGLTEGSGSILSSKNTAYPLYGTIIGSVFWTNGINGGNAITSTNVNPNPSSIGTTSNYVEVPFLPGLYNASAFTIETTFKQKTDAVNNPVIFQIGSWGGGIPFFLAYHAGNAFSLWQQGTNNLLNVTTASTTVIGDGNWHHLVDEWTGPSNLLYIDGQILGQWATDGQIAYPPGGSKFIMFGALQGGSLGPVRFWTRALTADEINLQYLKAFAFSPTKGIASTCLTTNMVLTATGCTNTTGVTQIVNIYSGSSLQLFDAAGNPEFAPAFNNSGAFVPFVVQPGGRITGATITYWGPPHAL